MEYVYLKQHHLDVYISDATYHILVREKKNPKFQPIPFLLSYFDRVRAGTHVFGRKFHFVSATPHNRKSFIKVYWQSFVRIIQEEKLLNSSDHHQLLQLLCQDFPLSLCNQVMEIRKKSDITLTEFIYTLQVLLYYSEFVEQCEVIFKGSNQDSSIIIVPPSSTINGNASTLSLASLEQLKHSLHDLHMQMTSCQSWVVIPSLPCLQHVIKMMMCSATQQRDVSFNDFLSYLCNCSELNEEIGVLPQQELLLDTEPPIISK
jgi:hypothetical protein